MNDHLRALERKGYLRREDMKSRALKLVEEPTQNVAVRTPVSDEDMVEIAVLGRVAAGLPLLAEENVVDTVRLNSLIRIADVDRRDIHAGDRRGTQQAPRN